VPQPTKYQFIINLKTARPYNEVPSPHGPLPLGLRVRVTPKDIEDAREYGGPDAVFQAAPDGTGVYLIHRIRQVARPT
jgi:hypothetical protein